VTRTLPSCAIWRRGYSSFQCIRPNSGCRSSQKSVPECIYYRVNPLLISCIGT
jgi:hypothetical protein